MPSVRIYRPARTAMQSGTANTREWVMEFEPGLPKSHDPLMGWTSSADTREQVHLRFANAQEAVAYAERQGYSYTLSAPPQHRLRPRPYADNFKYNRLV